MWDNACGSAGVLTAARRALQVCKEAEIMEIVKDSEEAVQTEYLEMRTNSKGMH